MNWAHIRIHFFSKSLIIIIISYLCWILLMAAKRRSRSNCLFCSDNLALVLLSEVSTTNFLEEWSGVEVLKPETSKAVATIWRPLTGCTWTWWWWWWWWCLWWWWRFWCLWCRCPGGPPCPPPWFAPRLTFTFDEDVEVAGDDWSVLKRD